jgi:formate hydrogenlyase subunit 3/multisubunit Na+/H+ antiporter MnhD subunit
MYYKEHKNLGLSWFFYNLLVSSMALVCMARNGILFLIAWELMALSSFFLVAFESDKVEVRKASWTYMVATYLGTVCLLPMFLILGSVSGSLDFDTFGRGLSSPVINLCFILALVGFGTKAGIVPFHVWLPEAHPAAPSHVSALMSGVMIKTGIYGLLRILSCMGTPPLWWGWVVLGVGTVSGILGVIFALAKHDLKRLLAYSSVENIGIILMGLGVGMIGWSSGSSLVAVLGFAGALLHILNHALFKGLLFLGAGSVYHSTGTREINHLGGLIKKMPYTGLCFLIGSAAISALPPLNGFVSEFLIYAGSFTGAISMGPEAALPLAGAIAGLGLIGGLAAACFTKAFGMVFLGEPRSSDAEKAHEAGIGMILPMMTAAGACVVIGLSGPWMLRAMTPMIAGLLGVQAVSVADTASLWLSYISAGAIIFLILVFILFRVRQKLLSGREIGQTGTWDCGYAAPTARMQYSASSFAEPTTDLFRTILRTRKQLSLEEGYFPSQGRFQSHTPDLGREQVFQPVFKEIERAFSRLRFLQQGRIQTYVLYIVCALLVLLLWNMR